MCKVKVVSKRGCWSFAPSPKQYVVLVGGKEHGYFYTLEDAEADVLEWKQRGYDAVVKKIECEVSK
tara:strand:- start:476 stop:673 length:198 start_codon:yes stop_codon:yes gene_type:complete